MPPKKKTQAETLKDAVNAVMGEQVVTMGNDPSLIVKFLPTGCLPIDYILNGGLPRRRFVEFYGDYSTLKSYLAYLAIATTQRNGGTAALVDTEHSFDPAWATRLGVTVSDLIMPPVETGEDAVDTSEVLIRNGVDLMVWDSIAATFPQDEAKKKLGKENIQPGRLAALMSAMLRRLNAANVHTAMLYINQTRESIGVTFGSPTTTPGGKAMGFYSSYRVELRKAGKVTEEVKRLVPGDKPGKLKTGTVKRTNGHKIKAVVQKSKLSAPFSETMLYYDLRTGRVDEIGFLIAMGVEHKWIIQRGQSYHLGRRKPVRGIDAFRASLEADPAVLADLGSRVMALTRADDGTPAPAKRRVVRKKSS